MLKPLHKQKLLVSYIKVKVNQNGQTADMYKWLHGLGSPPLVSHTCMMISVARCGFFIYCFCVVKHNFNFHGDGWFSDAIFEVLCGE